MGGLKPQQPCLSQSWHTEMNILTPTGRLELPINRTVHVLTGPGQSPERDREAQAEYANYTRRSPGPTGITLPTMTPQTIWILIYLSLCYCIYTTSEFYTQMHAGIIKPQTRNKNILNVCTKCTHQEEMTVCLMLFRGFVCATCLLALGGAPPPSLALIFHVSCDLIYSKLVYNFLISIWTHPFRCHYYCGWLQLSEKMGLGVELEITQCQPSINYKEGWGGGSETVVKVCTCLCMVSPQEVKSGKTSWSNMVAETAVAVLSPVLFSAKCIYSLLFTNTAFQQNLFIFV